MASSNTQMRSSIPSSAPKVWDVFLSFRGEDTRLNFTSHLYTTLCHIRISMFMDDPELRSGQVISSGLLHAIQNSKTYIVVLSQKYASSSWCPDELVEILKCCKSAERLVHPVFYFITLIHPSIVRHQTGSYKVAFQKHQDLLVGDIYKLNKWRLTLTQVDEFSGYHVNGTRSETDIINEVVGGVLVEVNPANLHVAKYPVGLDSRVRDITPLLSSGSKGVTRIGIYGMCGVEKTTLAKGLYNQEFRRFYGSCFLANVREVSGQPDGRVRLQEQLIADILKVKEFSIHNIDEGIELIRERICSKRVLVVVDDINHRNQLDYLVGPFACGSVIIVTTRVENLLNTIEVESKYQYKVKELNNAESVELFHRHVFKNIKPYETLVVLSEDVLRHAGGLPLALEVFGSSLLNQTEKGCRYFIEKLQRFSNSYVKEKLMISFKALDLEDPTLKNIFVDIACFFIGMKKNFVVERMETSYWFMDHKIDILKKRCLITISKENVLGMHDLLGDMGMEIARNKSLYELGKHSRLWQFQDIYDVLMKKKVLAKLKVLNVSYSLELTITPDFSGVLCLEMLILVGCESRGGSLVNWMFGKTCFFKLGRLLGAKKSSR